MKQKLKRLDNFISKQLPDNLDDDTFDPQSQPKDESKEVKEGFTVGEWELDDSSKVGVTLWANDKRDEGTCLATIYTEAKEWEANAALISQAKNMYYALKEIRNWYEQNSLRLAPDTPICFSKALSVLQQANPLFY